jgi:hypothetical protein
MPCMITVVEFILSNGNMVLTGIFRPKRDAVTRENCVKGGFMVCTLRQVSLGR